MERAGPKLRLTPRTFAEDWQGDSRANSRFSIRASEALLIQILISALYGASKSAVTTASETLRLELAPFNVRVLIVHAGVISTRFEQNMTEFSLGPNSLYQPIAEDVRKDSMNENFHEGMKPDIFADHVVRDVMSGKSGKIWWGTMAPMVKYAHWLTPTVLFDRMLSQTSGLGKLSKLVRERKT